MKAKIIGFIVISLIFFIKLVERKYFKENKKKQEEFKNRVDKCIKLMEKNTEKIIKEEKEKTERLKNILEKQRKMKNLSKEKSN